MVNQTGKAYTSLPTAFAYRQNFDLTNTCKPQVTGGQITVTDLGGGQSRAMVSYGGDTFPLPIRDPRASEKATTVAAAAVIDIPQALAAPGCEDGTGSGDTTGCRPRDFGQEPHRQGWGQDRQGCGPRYALCACDEYRQLRLIAARLPAAQLAAAAI